jgi:hypothetical protein
MLKIKSFTLSLCEIWNEGHTNLHLTRGVSAAMSQKKSQIFTILHSLSFSQTRDNPLAIRVQRHLFN